MPTGWFYACSGDALRRGPVRVELGARTFICFRDAAGRAVTLDARCSHMGADLSGGEIVDGRIRCPLHAWEYAGDGRCAHIPAAPNAGVPPLARQAVFPTVELEGHVVFCNALTPPFPMPFYENRSPEQLRPAEPFELIGKTPWYMIGGNAFDVQHFRVAHDRTLVDTPVVDSPAPYARRIAATYDVTGDSLRDRVTRKFSGPRVRMSVTSWAGVNILVTAEFRRTTTYGMVFVQPIGTDACRLRVIVWIDRREGALGRTLLDPIDSLVRRAFIREFLRDDQAPMSGVRYNPATLIDADRPLREYFDWLAGACSNISSNTRLGEGNPHETPIVPSS